MYFNLARCELKFGERSSNKSQNTHGAQNLIEIKGELEEIKGISEVQGIDFEPDQFSKIAALFKIGFKPNTKFSFDFFTNFDKIKTVVDVVVFPMETRLIKRSQELEKKVIPGHLIALEQFIEQFKLYTGIYPPRKILEASLLRLTNS
jgi:shikimate 5-dehydrogenase